MKNKLNCYSCEECGHITVTVDRDEGVTPFMIGCTKKECEGMSQSSMYRVHPGGLTPTHEWYKADSVDEVRKLANEEADKIFDKEDEHYELRREGLISGMVDHYKSGGLDLREIRNGK